MAKKESKLESKVLKILLIVLLFLGGLFIGENATRNSNDYRLEEERRKFEEEITKPGNEYEKSYPSIIQGPEPNVTTNIAQTIDKGILSVVDKIFSTLAQLLSDDK